MGKRNKYMTFITDPEQHKLYTALRMLAQQIERLPHCEYKVVDMLEEILEVSFIPNPTSSSGE